MSDFKLPATATLQETGGLAREIEALLATLPAGEPLAIDASAVKALDTSAIALLLHARRLAQGGGRRFELRGAPDKLAQLSKLYGVEALLDLGPGPAA